MAQSRRPLSAIPPAAFERPACPLCKARMMLVSIEPERPGVDLHSFQCAVCNHVLTALAAHEDAVHSKALGRWLQGDAEVTPLLRPRRPRSKALHRTPAPNRKPRRRRRRRRGGSVSRVPASRRPHDGRTWLKSGYRFSLLAWLASLCLVRLRSLLLRGVNVAFTTRRFFAAHVQLQFSPARPHSPLTKSTHGGLR